MKNPPSRPYGTASLQRALGTLDTVLALDARHVTALANKGYCYLQLGRYLEAIAGWSR